MKHKNQDTVTVQAFYLSNPHKLMDIRQSGPLLKAAAHTGQCTPTHLHKSFLSQSLYFKVSIDLLALVPPPSFPRLQSDSLHSKSFLYLPYSTWFRAVPEPNLILKHSIVPIAFQSFPQMWKSCPYSKHINIWQHYKLATTIFWYRSTLILEWNCLFTFALLNAVPSHEKWGHCLG